MLPNWRIRGDTNVGHIELPGPAKASSAASRAACKVSTEGAASKAWFGFAVLSRRLSASPTQSEQKRQDYLANVDESTHEALVAKRVDSVLRLLPRRVFHNPAELDQLRQGSRCDEYSPASLQYSRGTSPSRQPKQSMEVPRRSQDKRKKPAKLHNGAHLRHSVRKKQDIGEDDLSSCKRKRRGPPMSVSSIPGSARNRYDMTLLTLSHEIFQVMPLDIVG